MKKLFLNLTLGFAVAMLSAWLLNTALSADTCDGYGPCSPCQYSGDCPPPPPPTGDPR